MDKKGNTAFVGILIIILVIFGIKGFFEEDIPNTLEELKNNICIPIKENADICFINESGIRLKGKFENFQIELNEGGKKDFCLISGDTYNFKPFCEKEFGYLYKKQDFNLLIKENGQYIMTIPKNQIYGLFFNVVRNPKIIGKNLWKDAEGAFILRGIIYLGEHPEIFNQTNKDN